MMLYDTRDMEPCWGEPGMDALHEELFSSLRGLANSNDGDFRFGFGLLVRQVEHVFAREEAWMDAIDFDGALPHREQHARVLAALHQVHSRVMRSELATGRDVVERLLPQWLLFHTETMDSALARSMQSAEAETMSLGFGGTMPRAPATVH